MTVHNSSDALAAEMITTLVNDGYTVAKTPAGALKIDLDVQAVTFSAVGSTRTSLKKARRWDLLEVPGTTTITCERSLRSSMETTTTGRRLVSSSLPRVGPNSTK